MPTSRTTRRRVALCLLVFACWLAPPVSGVTVKDVRKKMGSRFEVTAVHADEAQARQAIARAYAEIDRIEAMISSWRPDSETSEVNRNAGQQPVAVAPELFGLIRRALKVSALTDGAFDITFAGVGHLWDFQEAVPRRPDPVAVRAALAHIGYHKVHLDTAAQTVFLDDPAARIGFGAIGKGYVANRAALTLRENGIEAGVVNAGGDMLAFGHREDGAPWQIGIAHPRQRDQIFAYLNLSDQAVVTSGDYERFFLLDGKRYAHILDPRSGEPVSHLQSVTIVCPDAELADALATGVFVLGPEVGLRLINELRGIEALLVDFQGRLYFSDNLRSLFVQPERTDDDHQGDNP